MMIERIMMPGPRTLLAPHLSCEIHGPLRRRPECQLWVCPGFDGEACLNLPDGIPDDAYDRVSSGRTRWPGLVAHYEPIARIPA